MPLARRRVRAYTGCMTADVLLTDEHRLLRDTVLAFARRELAPIADEIDRTDAFPPDLFRRLGDLGVLGVTVPRSTAALAPTSCRACSSSSSWRACRHRSRCRTARTPTCASTTSTRTAPRSSAAPTCRASAPAIVGALAITEPNAGSDAVGISTTAVADGDDFVLNGTKMFITNGTIADVFVLYAKTSPEQGSHGITTFIIEKGFPRLFRVTQARQVRPPRLPDGGTAAR